MKDKQLQIKMLKHQLAVLVYQVNEARLAHLQECQVADALGELVEDMADRLREQAGTIEKQSNEIEALKAIIATDRLPTDAERAEFVRVNARRLVQ